MNIINVLQSNSNISAIANEVILQLNEKELWSAWRKLNKLVKEQRPTNVNPIALARRAKRITITQLSELTGYSRSQIRSAEHGGKVNVHLAMRLSEVLDVALAELFQTQSEVGYTANGECNGVGMELTTKP